MSYHLAAWAMDVDVPPREKLLLILIASYANDDGECFPSQTTLAYRSGLSRRTVLRSLAELEERGVITRRPNRRSDGSRSSDTIRLNVHGAPVRPPLAGGSLTDRARVVFPPQGDSVTPGGDNLTRQGDTVSPHGDNDDAPRCPVVTAEPVIEPIREPVRESSAADAAAQRPEPEPGAQTIVGAWIDACGDARPPRRVIGHLSKQVRELLDEGQPYADVLAAVQVWHSKGLNPASLPSVLHEMRQHGTRPRTGGERAAQAHAALRERTAWTPPATPGARPPVFPSDPLPLQIEG